MRIILCLLTLPTVISACCSSVNYNFSGKHELQSERYWIRAPYLIDPQSQPPAEWVARAPGHRSRKVRLHAVEGQPQLWYFDLSELKAGQDYSLFAGDREFCKILPCQEGPASFKVNPREFPNAIPNAALPVPESLYLDFGDPYSPAMVFRASVSTGSSMTLRLDPAAVSEGEVLIVLDEFDQSGKREKRSVTITSREMNQKPVSSITLSNGTCEPAGISVKHGRRYRLYFFDDGRPGLPPLGGYEFSVPAPVPMPAELEHDLDAALPTCKPASYTKSCEKSRVEMYKEHPELVKRYNDYRLRGSRYSSEQLHMRKLSTAEILPLSLTGEPQ